MLDRRAWAERHADDVRRVLMFEPRGHADMSGAVLTEPVSPGAHAGLLFMHNDGYGAMCGHAVIAVTTIALERGLLMPGGDGSTVVFDTPAGSVRAQAEWATAEPESPSRVQRVAYTSVPSFVFEPGVAVRAAGRTVRADVAYGGAFFAIVDAESVGLPLDPAHLPELRRVGLLIREAVGSAVHVVHPLEAGLAGLYGTIFTGPPATATADLRNVTVFAGGEVDRSPCGSGTAAVMAVVDAMGLLDSNRPFVHEGLVGTCFRGRLADRTQVGEFPAIIPELEGSAWITGEHLFIVDEHDPLGEGFRLDFR
jgi:proline racemase